MIVKELDECFCEDKFTKAGLDAEKQMAYYLKHKFYSDNNIFVINNLRFPWLDDYTQIDHLIIHEFGAIIIESKSVSSKVRYNDLGEWNRLWNNEWKGIGNPVKQAERQSDALKKLLQKNDTILRNKLLGMQQGFGYIQIDCIVAISDKCDKIERPSNDPYKNIVIKADLVTELICKIRDDYKKRSGLFSKGVPPWKMSLEETIRVKDFLLKQHEPLKVKQEHNQNETQQPVEKTATKYSIEEQATSTVKEEHAKYSPVPPVEKEEKIHSLSHCPKCKGDVAILWGNKHKNYYWHCRHCSENIGINFRCPGCKEKLKIRKELKQYFIYCEPCKLQALFYAEK